MRHVLSCVNREIKFFISSSTLETSLTGDGGVVSTVDILFGLDGGCVDAPVQQWKVCSISLVK